MSPTGRGAKCPSPVRHASVPTGRQVCDTGCMGSVLGTAVTWRVRDAGSLHVSRAACYHEPSGPMVLVWDVQDAARARGRV